MNSIKSLIFEYLHDTLYEAEVVCRSDRSKNITIVTDNMRGVCGITVVTITGPAQPVGTNVEKTRLRVKFFQVEPTMQKQVERMALDARKIDGVHSFIPVRVTKVINRIYRK
jgi:hypothetical protein